MWDTEVVCCLVDLLRFFQYRFVTLRAAMKPTFGTCACPVTKKGLRYCCTRAGDSRLLVHSIDIHYALSRSGDEAITS